MRILGLCTIALAAAGVAAASAAAKPWVVHTVSTPGPAISRAVDMLPGGRVAAVIQRSAGSSNRLELKAGTSTRLLDTSAHQFLAADVQHDSRGRLVVVWRREVVGAVQAFAWTLRGGMRQLTSGHQSVTHLSLSVSPNGRAALVYWSLGGIFLARGMTARGFGARVAVAPAGTFDVQPDVAIARSGRVVVAWSDGKRILARAANGSGSLGPPQAVSLRAPAAGTTLVAGAPEIAITTDGRAVVTVTSSELRGGPPASVVDRRVEAFDWPPQAPRPSAAATFSRGAAAGDAEVVAQGNSAVVAWTQRPPGAPRALWVTRWTSKGVQRPNVYDTHGLDLPLLLTLAPKSAVDVFYRAGGQRWFTVRLSTGGLFSGTATVTPPGEQVPSIDVAAAGASSVAGWTAGKRNTRVEIARPAG